MPTAIPRSRWKDLPLHLARRPLDGGCQQPPSVPGGSPVIHRAWLSPFKHTQRHIRLRGEAISPSPSKAITIPRPQRHTTLRGVCLLHPPGTPSLHGSCQSASPVPGGKIYHYTWHAHLEWRMPTAIPRARWKSCHSPSMTIPFPAHSEAHPLARCLSSASTWNANPK